jgi:hypothetical protein
MAYQLPVVVQNQGHSPMVVPTNQLDPRAFPISAFAGNTIRSRSDGLYAGSVPELSVLYVNSSGTDAATGGAKTAPLKTLDYTLQLVAQNYTAGQTITVALQAGQTFPVTIERLIACNLTLTYYGDATYADFNSPQVTTAPNATMTNLQRPIITPSAYVSTVGQNRVAAVVAPSLTLSGVQVNLPARPSPAPDGGSYGPMDFYRCNTDQFNGRLKLFGAIINAVDALGYAGILGVMSRTQVVLDQFASQFLVNGAQVVAGSDANSLTRRASFIKFYQDYPGVSDQTPPFLNPSALNSSNGSGLLTLHWSDTTFSPIGGTSNVATYPVLADPTYGLRQYFVGLRKNGAIPVNVISPRVGL